jgi:hypothetical protein
LHPERVQSLGGRLSSFRLGDDFAVNGIGRSANPPEVIFWAEAWKADHKKAARAAGWLSS